MAKRLKIYFACSIKGNPDGVDEKKLVVTTIQELGHHVLSEIFASDGNVNLKNGRVLNPLQVYQRDMKWVKGADVIVAEVSRPSLGVGYEVASGISLGKKVVALCKKENLETLSFMFRGNNAKKFKLCIWKNEKDLKSILEKELGRMK